MEVELFSHFPKRTYEVQYLLPDLFFDREIVKGKFYAGLSSLIPANFFPDKIGKKTYMGVMIYGENQAGVTLPPKTYVNEQLILFTPIPNIKYLILDNNSQKKAEEIQKGRLIEGYWWEIFIEPVPFSSVSEIARYIGSGNEDKGISELVDNLQSELNHLHESIYVGLRFPGRLRETDWQMFRLNKGSRPPIVGGGKEELKQRLLDYSVQAVYQEYFTDEHFHRRNLGRAARGILKNKAISIIGCGALGSEVADVICKAGVGKILLVDKEEMRAHNAVRHNLGINRVSIPKALGMKEQLVLHNPFVDVKCNFSNILFANIDDYFPEDTIGVSTIADDNIEAYLNELAIN
ncbi:MAG: ThiF family adenylyltransferase, partial [Proteobacteria bacterium]|nr:ThiF family adenylyltransferase [Pseudomonadota bacterium]